jgi:hypothetical protein
MPTKHGLDPELAADLHLNAAELGTI